MQQQQQQRDIVSCGRVSHAAAAVGDVGLLHEQQQQLDVVQQQLQGWQPHPDTAVYVARMADMCVYIQRC